jgi:NADPH:quinone reductase-like Zn-dependent oxidoreductase
MQSTTTGRWSRKKSTLAVLALVAVAMVALWLQDEPATPAPRGSGEFMQAVVYDQYGSAEVLRLERIEKMLPDDHQVLVKVHAAAANPLDWHYMRGTPYLVRTESGFRKPKTGRLGVDMAGVIVDVGSRVTRFKAGDAVFGTGGGAFAEYVRASESRIALKPARLTFEQAAAVPVAAVTALQALRDKGRLQAGQKVLINGASGGVGTFAVQIAKALGAEVTGVSSTRNVAMVQALGADHVIDYKKEDFTAGTRQYDVILDNVGNHSLRAYRRVMSPGGIYVLIGGGGPDDDPWLGPVAGFIKTVFFSPFVSQEFVTLLASINHDDLSFLKGLIEAQKITPVIDRTYPLAGTAAAIRYLEQGRARGKVIITVAGEDATSAAGEATGAVTGATADAAGDVTNDTASDTPTESATR